MLNDLCAACWFTYLLVMLRDARGIVSWKSAIVLLAGQAADAFATPLCGLASDRSTGLRLWPFRLRLERRQTWYLFGTVLVAINFLCIFGVPLPLALNPDCPEWGLLLYYCAAASLFNVGWAAVQVSHMAMVPELSRSEHTRVVLNSARYSESVVANVAVFAILAVWSALISDSEKQYQYVSFTTLAFGLICSLAFLLGIREKPARKRRRRPQSEEQQEDDSPSGLSSPLSLSPSSPRSPSPTSSPASPSSMACCGRWSFPVPLSGWQSWLYCVDFYKVGVVYMCSRLVVNVSQVFLAFYVLDTLQMPRLFITIVPCVVYLSSFLAALVMRRLNKSFGRKAVTSLGTLFCIVALCLLFVLQPESAHLVYIPAVLLGVGNGVITVMSTQLEADLIGRKTEHGAFVYGALSFTDKMANGIALFFLQSGNVDADDSDGDVMTGDPEYIRLSIVVLPLAACLAALAMLLWGIDIQAMIDRGNEPDQTADDDERKDDQQAGGDAAEDQQNQTQKPDSLRGNGLLHAEPVPTSGNGVRRHQEEEGKEVEAEE